MLANAAYLLKSCFHSGPDVASWIAGETRVLWLPERDLTLGIGCGSQSSVVRQMMM